MAITRNRLLASALILLMVAVAASALAAEHDGLDVLRPGTYSSSDLEATDSVRHLYYRIGRIDRNHCPDVVERRRLAGSTDCTSDVVRDPISTTVVGAPAPSDLEVPAAITHPG